MSKVSLSYISSKSIQTFQILKIYYICFSVFFRPEDIFVCNVDTILRSNTNELLPFKNRFLSALQCVKCKKVFQTKSSFNFHTKNAHSGKMFVCKKCKIHRYFKYSKNLIAHMNEYHGETITANQMRPVILPKINDARKGNENSICQIAKPK